MVGQVGQQPHLRKESIDLAGHPAELRKACRDNDVVVGTTHATQVG